MLHHIGGAAPGAAPVFVIRCRPFFLPLLIALLLAPAQAAVAQVPPDPPVITEPAHDGQVVNPADVHMEVAPMVDADGDAHLCSDFEIWIVDPHERVWVTACIGGVERLHTHLGDGAFENTHADLSELLPDTDYVLRVRFQDDGGDWSAWSERAFRTGAPSTVFGLQLTDVLDSPTPTMTDPTGVEPELPDGAAVEIEGVDGVAFLRFEGREEPGNLLADATAREEHDFVRVEVQGGPGGCVLPEFDLAFTDDDGTPRILYLPATQVAAGASRAWWITNGGASFVADPGQTTPDFSDLARGAAVPWRSVTRGFRTEVVATGFQLPVNIAFVPEPSTAGHAPFFYVSELYGNVRVVTRDLEVRDYATGLLNFDPTGNFPGSGEQGLAGIVVEPATGDLFVGLLYDAAPPDGPHYPKVIRMRSVDGGLSAASVETVLDMPGETQGQSHFISNLSIGPDDKLYVHMGDGFDAGTALDLDSFRGKILRLELDGAPCDDNPFFDASDGISARDYVWAYGLRNPFGGAWRARDGQHYSVENGPGDNDRFARIDPGASYGWDGTAASMLVGALYTWDPPHAPVNIAFVEEETFSGSGFPDHLLDRAYVTESGPTWATGGQSRGKRIVSFGLDEEGGLLDGPVTLVEYEGSGKATAVGLAPGPDGLYFTDLYRDLDYTSPIDVGANVLRTQWIGAADFLMTQRVGAAPLSVRFVDVSRVPGAFDWHWDFGDGTTSTVRNPTHVYTEPGVYDVRLEVRGARGLVVERKTGAIYVGQTGTGLLAEIFDTIDLTGPSLTRIDPRVDFDWGPGSPDPAIDPNTFSVRWTGRIEIPTTDPWTFVTRTDDGVRLWVDNQLVVDAWRDQPPTEHSGSLELAAGSYDLRMEVYENGGGAVARLSWESPSRAREVVPTEALSAEPIAQPTSTPPGIQDRRVTLDRNRPNPFNPRTRIGFGLPSSGTARIEVFDLRGRRLATPLPERRLEPGEHAVVFEGNDGRGRPLASGVYLYRLTFRPEGGSPVEIRTRRMVLVE